MLTSTAHCSLAIPWLPALSADVTFMTLSSWPGPKNESCFTGRKALPATSTGGVAGCGAQFNNVTGFSLKT